MQGGQRAQLITSAPAGYGFIHSTRQSRHGQHPAALQGEDWRPIMLAAPQEAQLMAALRHPNVLVSWR